MQPMIPITVLEALTRDGYAIDWVSACSDVDEDGDAVVVSLSAETPDGLPMNVHLQVPAKAAHSPRAWWEAEHSEFADFDALEEARNNFLDESSDEDTESAFIEDIELYCEKTFSALDDRLRALW